MKTMAVKSMEHILRQYGRDHLKLTLMTIAETDHNRRELAEPTLWAMSDLIAAHPAWAARVTD
jgi:hypothetical protein